MRRNCVISSVLGLGLIIGMSMFLVSSAIAQTKEIVWTAEEKTIREEMRGLRALEQEERSRTTKELALKIRMLPAADNKVKLATSLSNLSTEGDLGKATLQAVATTLADALREKPQPNEEGGPAYPYRELARLMRYEHVESNLDSPSLHTAMAAFEEEDRTRQSADFTLQDLRGKKWTLHELKGNVVLLNFWATWCSPCRKEMPDLEALYQQFKDRGFLVLAVSADKIDKIRAYIEKEKLDYPVLLDSEGKVSKAFAVEGIPHSFVFDREGKLAAQSTDMRTRGQFLEMLAQAGMKP